MRPPPSTRRAALTLLLTASVFGCGGSDEERVVVFAASSLTEAFAEIEDRFEDRFAGVDVVVVTAGSASLAAQLADGAPADVLATADERTMRQALDVVADAGDPVVMARNTLVIAVEPGNPLGVTGLGDLATDAGTSAVVVLAAPEVPAGAYAAEVLACSGVEVDAASLESNVRAAAAKVVLGEADAAIVYRTDVTDDLEAVELGADCAADVVYPIVALSDTAVADTFVEFVVGPDGSAVLTAEGFEAP